MQARTSPSLRLPVIMGLPVRFRCLTTSQYLTHRDPSSHKRDHASATDVRSEVFRSRRAGEIRQDGRPRTYGLTHSYTWHVATMEGHLKTG